MIKKSSPPFIAFLQITALVLYILLIATFFNFMSRHFVDDQMQFIGPLIFLLLFVISAIISGLLILGRAGMLFWDKMYKESFELIGWTVGWGILYLTLFVLILALR